MTIVWLTCNHSGITYISLHILKIFSFWLSNLSQLFAWGGQIIGGPLIGKDPDAGRDWGQEEKGMTEDGMAGWHRWAWVCVNSGSWWWTGRPGMLWFMGSQRVGHNWATELNWTEVIWDQVALWQGCDRQKAVMMECELASSYSRIHAAAHIVLPVFINVNGFQML